MSTVIIITPPPTKPPGSSTLLSDDGSYDAARALIDAAEAAGDRVRVVDTDE